MVDDDNSPGDTVPSMFDLVYPQPVLEPMDWNEDGKREPDVQAPYSALMHSRERRRTNKHIRPTKASLRPKRRRV